MNNNFADGQLLYTGNESNPLARLLKKISPARNVNHSEECLANSIFMEQFSNKSDLVSRVLNKAKKSGTFDYNRKLRTGLIGGIGGAYAGAIGATMGAGIKHQTNLSKGNYINPDKGIGGAAALGAGLAGSAVGVGLPALANKLIDRNFKKEIKYRMSLGDISEDDLKKYLDGTTTPAMKTVLKKIQGQIKGVNIARTDN